MGLIIRLVLLFTLLNFSNILCLGRSPVTGYGGMVGSMHHLASQAGIDILSAGGNAADAALAVQLTLNVVIPMFTGIGGGCFIVYYNASNNKVFTIDGREEAPNTYHSNIFCKDFHCFLNNGTSPNCDCNSSTLMNYTEKRVGGLSIGVPGTLSAFAKLHKYFSTKQWNDSFQFAINTAENGFPMYKQMYDGLKSNPYLLLFNATRDIFYNENGSDVKSQIGELYFNKDLAKTLRLLSEGRETALDIFYNNEIADAIVKIQKDSNNTISGVNDDSISYRWGLMTKNDIQNYEAVFRTVLQSKLGNTSYTMYGANMPTSGSISVQYLMNLMHSLFNDPSLQYLNAEKEMLDSESYINAANINYMITANNILFADRNEYMADQDFISNIPIEGLMDYNYIKKRSEIFFSLKAVKTPLFYGCPPDMENCTSDDENTLLTEEHGTAHFFVVDQWNNIASVTTTIEGYGGSCVTVPGYGFLLNNELTDFDGRGITDEGKIVANGPQGGKRQRTSALDLFGLHDSTTIGGKRPRSSMAPIIVVDDDTKLPAFTVGAPGGSSIIATVFETLFNVMIRKMNIQQSVDAYRIWAFNNEHPSLELLIDSNLSLQLTAMGYNISNFKSMRGGSCQAMQFGGKIEGSDLLMMYGGCDDMRWNTSQCLSVCKGDGSDVDVLSVICSNKENTDGGWKFTNAQKIILLSSCVIVLVFALCVFINRDRIYRWREKRKRRNYAFYGMNENQMFIKNR